VNRSVLDLATTLPNVSGDVGFDQTVVVSNTTAPGFNLSINGGRPGSNLILADGANNTGVSLSRAVVTFSPETVQEFTVQTSVYSAEYGTSGGGIINATTKSGTNAFNGTALYYMRNPVFEAAPWTNAVTNRPVATLKSNQFFFCGWWSGCYSQTLRWAQSHLLLCGDRTLLSPGSRHGVCTVADRSNAQW